METLREKVLEILRYSHNEYVSINKIKTLLGVSARKLKRVINHLLSDGEVIKKGGKIALLERVGYKIRGKLDLKRGGYGFVITEDGEIFIPAWAIDGAYDGDIVEVIVFPKPRRRKLPEGKILKVIKPARKYYLGTYVGKGKVRLDDPIGRIINIPKKHKLRKGEGVLMIREKDQWKVSKVNPDDYEIIIKTFNLPTKFPKEVLRESEDLNLRDDPRIDLTDEFSITIDPKTAKDYDDAIYVERYEKGWILKVHIADVSFWVKKGGFIDKEAYKRGNSVYLIDKVIPMLPPVLSDDLASLIPGKPKNTFTVEVKITRDGRILYRTAKFYKSRIMSWARLTYEDAQRLLEGARPEDRETKIHKRALAGIRRVLKDASDLVEVLRGKREDRGSIDFDIPEPEFVISGDRILMVSPKERLWTHKIIEELMITANMVVATYFRRNNIPTLYRVHAQPKDKKVKEFISLAEKILHKDLGKKRITPKFLRRILEEFKGRDEEKLMSYLLLRSMARAEYSPKNIGHFGLAIDNYLHFTSPIRRYADLIVHRQLWASLKGKPLPYSYKELVSIGKHLSEMERVAEDAEWELWRLKIYEFMRNKVGQVFEGIVVGFSSDAMFVEITEHLAEGFVPLSSIKGRVLTFPEEYSIFIFKRKRNIRISLGDKVRVKVMNVDKYAKEMVLRLIL